ncbi:MAG TPA: hypothetical protein VJ001_10500 [Rhodocyclaceae bacterium]|nr:hypothetical protein [Rhodocyclaceae bacterium]
MKTLRHPVLVDRCGASFWSNVGRILGEFEDTFKAIAASPPATADGTDESTFDPRFDRRVVCAIEAGLMVSI